MPRMFEFKNSKFYEITSFIGSSNLSLEQEGFYPGNVVTRYEISTDSFNVAILRRVPNSISAYLKYEFLAIFYIGNGGLYYVVMESLPDLLRFIKEIKYLC